MYFNSRQTCPFSADGPIFSTSFETNQQEPLLVFFLLPLLLTSLPWLPPATWWRGTTRPGRTWSARNFLGPPPRPPDPWACMLSVNCPPLSGSASAWLQAHVCDHNAAPDGFWLVAKVVWCALFGRYHSLFFVHLCGVVVPVQRCCNCSSILDRPNDLLKVFEQWMPTEMLLNAWCLVYTFKLFSNYSCIAFLEVLHHLHT